MSRRHRNATELAQHAAVEVFTAEGGYLPTGTERVLMASLGIQFDGRAFRFAGCRYDRLADAVNYARRANATDSH